MSLIKHDNVHQIFNKTIASGTGYGLKFACKSMQTYIETLKYISQKGRHPKACFRLNVQSNFYCMSSVFFPNPHSLPKLVETAEKNLGQLQTCTACQACVFQNPHDPPKLLPKPLKDFHLFYLSRGKFQANAVKIGTDR